MLRLAVPAELFGVLSPYGSSFSWASRQGELTNFLLCLAIEISTGRNIGPWANLLDISRLRLLDFFC
ncbi:Uncharacterised protein [Vibrio vulnificus]|nr:Uncharacterised protein [Vibrio vulnificus]